MSLLMDNISRVMQFDLKDVDHLSLIKDGEIYVFESYNGYKEIPFDINKYDNWGIHLKDGTIFGKYEITCRFERLGNFFKDDSDIVQTSVD